MKKSFSPKYILVLNSGSSSLKFEVFQTMGNKEPKSIASGICDAIDLKNSSFKITTSSQEHQQKVDIPDHSAAIHLTLDVLEKLGIIDRTSLLAVAHRVVHGGEKYTKATLITSKVIKDIEKLSELAPLHNPVNLQGIYDCAKLLPKIKQVAVFDTAYYHTMPQKAWLYALPQKFYKQFGLRRYGFHGTSHKFVTHKALQLIRKKNAKIISIHLGNGCSITASINGQAIETSMGFTPLEGVIMGTRSGSIDPSIPLFLQNKLKLLPYQVENILNKQSGLLALSEKSSDMRIIYAASQKKDKKSLLAIELFCYQIAKTVASYLAALGTPDALIFTASMGENAFYIRQNILTQLSALPFKLDSKKNKKPQTATNQARIISTPASKTKILVIPTDENLQIAQECLDVIK